MEMQKMDALSEVLGHIRITDASWACTIATAPWGLSFREITGCVRFHYVVRGSCWLAAEKGAEPSLALSGGDLVVIAQGTAHTLRDQPRSSTRKFDALSLHAGSVTPGVKHVRVGGPGVETSVIYGAFMIEDPADTPVLTALPTVIRISPHVGEAVPSFLQNLQFIARELDSGRPGHELVLTRMADIIFVQVLRAYMESLPEGREGFLGALRDRHIAAALGFMHHNPEKAWTVGLLADQVGLSRSGFAARFAELVGEPPLGYLTRLRMRRASILLREGATLARVSEMTGYASEASFSHAFRQWAGIAPGAYRRQPDSSPSRTKTAS
jgi:AraC-like DNA-binding protein